MKTKVILDSDVIIHFIKGECLHILPRILPAYSFILLDIVYQKELAASHRTQIENTIRYFESITIEAWIPKKEELKEFMELSKKYGLGESASMVYCKYHQDVLASSNWKDILEYCECNKITYFSTMDFLYQAMKNGIMTEQQCDEFISNVLKKGSKLPVLSMKQFTPRLLL